MDYLTNVSISGFAAFIGTCAGAWVIIKHQNSKNKYPRELIIEILNVLKKYKTYKKAEDDFNARSIVEKRAVIVALKNLGVPILIDVINDSYDVNHVRFDDIEVDEKAIGKMKDFVEKGLCDNLFFKEIESNFYNASPKIVFARNLALKFINTLASQAGNATIMHVLGAAKINLNQFQIIAVFQQTVDVFLDDNVCKHKIDDAKDNIRNGVFDHLFYWDIRAFNNLNSQKNLADKLVNLRASAPAEVNGTDSPGV